MDLGLKGKVGVVTGGSVGIGLAIAEGLAAEGVDIVIAARGVERVRGEASRIAKSFGVRAEGLACDVATREGVDDLIADASKAIKKLGWHAKTKFEALVKIMLKHDLEVLGMHEAAAKLDVQKSHHTS